jgi:nicotinamidase-related amidase
MFAFMRFGLVLVALAAPLSTVAIADNVIAQWDQVKPPPAPALKPAKVEAEKTALLLFDFTTQTCTEKVRPRCWANVPGLARLLADARANRALVIFSVAQVGTDRKDVLPEIKPLDSEEVLPSLGPDKFLASDFEKDLKAKGITTLILTGTAAHSTVLHTGASAALRGFNVIVPVDGMSSNESYSESYTAWHLANAARVSAKVTLTRVDMISY